MIIGDFEFNVPVLLQTLVTIWAAFAVFILFFFYLGKEASLKNWISLFKVSGICALTLWLTMILMVCLHLKLTEQKGNHRGISTVYSSAAQVSG